MQDPDTSHLTGAAPAKQEPMAAKKKTGRRFPDDYKRQVIKRVLVGKRDGTETISAIAKDLKIAEQNIYTWLKKSKLKRANKPAEATPAKNGKAVARATEPEPAPAPPPVQASLEGCLAAIEQASATIRALRRQLFGG